MIAPNITISDNQNKDFYTDVSGSLENLGTTPIAYSPKLIVGNALVFKPVEYLQVSLLSKFIGKQYLNNYSDKNSMLPDYFVNDFNAVFTLPVKKVFKEVSVSVLANNVFNRKYISNAIDYGGGYIYYYPQAGANIMTGLTLKF